MDSIILNTPAKINWTLDITGTDERGYHLLDMLMQRITLYDTVTVKKQDSGIVLSSSEYWLPCDSRNTAYKSAELFFEFAKISGGCKIHINKRIPSGAGLAGGSADAAAVLVGLNRLYGNIFTVNELEKLALKIGADVPFMLRFGLCRARGIGEELQDIRINKPIDILCVMKYREPASTKQVYGLFDKINSRMHPDTEKFLEALKQNKLDDLKKYGGNVLTESAISIAGGIKENIDKMKKTKAKFVSMTGSGSVVFGVFKDSDSAKEAANEFADCWTYVCRASNCGIRIREEK